MWYCLEYIGKHKKYTSTYKDRNQTFAGTQFPYSTNGTIKLNVANSIIKFIIELSIILYVPSFLNLQKNVLPIYET